MRGYPYQSITKPQGFWPCGLLFGGDKRDRTADLLNAIQALSQLSYTPVCEVLKIGLPILRTFLNNNECNNHRNSTISAGN